MTELRSLVAELFQYAYYDYDRGEIVSSYDVASLGVTRGEVLADSTGFVSPSIDESDFEPLLFGWRASKYYPGKFSDSLNEGFQPRSPAYFEKIQCPKCGNWSVNYGGIVWKRDGSDAKQMYWCPACGKHFGDQRRRGCKMRYMNSLVDFAIEAAKTRTYKEVSRLILTKFGKHVSARSVWRWVQEKAQLSKIDLVVDSLNRAVKDKDGTIHCPHCLSTNMVKNGFPKCLCKDCGRSFVLVEGNYDTKSWGLKGAFRRGLEAANNNQPIDSCPYVGRFASVAYRNYWMAGWQRASEEAKE